MKNCGRCTSGRDCTNCPKIDNYHPPVIVGVTSNPPCAENLGELQVACDSGIAPPFGIAIDIGTTTLVFELISLRTGARVSMFSFVNSQRAYGLDVISRITRANNGDAAHLNSAIMGDLRKGIDLLLADKSVENRDISCVAVCGNTTMLHLLQNFSCETLGVFPFAPVSISSVQKKFFGYDMMILPSVSAFIGADVVAGIFCSAELHKTANSSLLIDLGTNGEIALFGGSLEEILVTSVAAGPAFEGGNISSGVASIPGAIYAAQFSAENDTFSYNTIGGKPPVGICGTGIISICAELVRHGLIDETGLLITGESVTVVTGESPIIFTQKDVREVQLAKSAVRAGIEILLEEAGISYENIEKVFLAGGFGYTMESDSAVTIGLFPTQLKNKIQAVGNAALGGCAKFLLNPACEPEIQKIAANAKEINLATHPRFEEIFIMHCDF